MEDQNIQKKKYIVDFIIEFEALAMKTETDNIHVIFLLKKNVRKDINRTILEYPPIVKPESLKEWKVAITSVGQKYKSIEGRQDYRTETGITYGEKGVFMKIRKSKDNYDKDRKPRCFNYNIYRYMAKDC